MKWSDLPMRFVEWVQANSVSGFDRAIEIITRLWSSVHQQINEWRQRLLTAYQ